jgi:hypothetical protein
LYTGADLRRVVGSEFHVELLQRCPFWPVTAELEHLLAR